MNLVEEICKIYENSSDDSTGQEKRRDEEREVRRHANREISGAGMARPASGPARDEDPPPPPPPLGSEGKKGKFYLGLAGLSWSLRIPLAMMT